jgi:dipeptidyl-peptidase-4
MLQAPDVYHVGVASALVADLVTTAYTPITPYMEYPDENPEGYDYADCLEWAGKLEGKLLITASTGDLNTPFAQTMKMVEAFIQADRPVDLMVFPDQHHWLQGESLDYFYEVLKDYFVEHLAPEGSQ